jgi:hypothetical protein
LFWTDNWAGECLTDLFPNIFRFVNDLSLSVKDVSSARYLEDLFHIPISQVAAVELQDLRTLLQSFELSDDMDIRIFCWGNSTYKAAILYKLAFLTNGSSGFFQVGLEVQSNPQDQVFCIANLN